MKTITTLATIVSLTLTAGLSADEKTFADYGREQDAPLIEDIPKEYEATTGVTLHFEKWTEKYGKKLLQCRLVNHSDRPVYFTGYSIQSPWYRIQKDEAAGWVDHHVGWFCGTGLRRPELPAGKSTIFWAAFPDKISKIRVGLNISENANDTQKEAIKELWTKEITKND